MLKLLVVVALCFCTVQPLVHRLRYNPWKPVNYNRGRMVYRARSIRFDDQPTPFRQQPSQTFVPTSNRPATITFGNAQVKPGQRQQNVYKTNKYLQERKVIVGKSRQQITKYLQYHPTALELKLGLNARNGTFFGLKKGTEKKSYIDISRGTATISTDRRGRCPVVNSNEPCRVDLKKLFGAGRCSNDYNCADGLKCCYDPCQASSTCKRPVQ